MIVLAEKWRTEIERRERRLKQLAKVDYKHQDEIDRRLNWCKIALDRLGAIRDGSEVHDLADIPARSAELDSISSVIEANIRAAQTERIGQYRNDGNAEEATALLAALDGLTIEAIEDRIAQLRDGRSAATFETELDGLVGEFTPRFVSALLGAEEQRDAMHQEHENDCQLHWRPLAISRTREDGRQE